MARSIDTDPLMSFNFALIEVPVLAVPPVAFPIKSGQSILDGSLLSFQSIEIPSMVIQTKKIQEGNWPFQHSVLLSAVQTGQVKIRQAITPINVDFFVWFTQAVLGARGSAPRRDFIVVQTRADKVIPRREIFLWGCIPVEWKPSTELDAGKNEIAIEELTLECNRVEVLPGIPG
jgi:phage tail-like protein